MKIGIMGGTFDPIHNGHLMLGREALRQYELDEVWFMPNGNPPHKDPASIQSDASDRAAMTALAIEGEVQFRLERYETDRRSVSYTFETLEHFHKCRAEDTLYFIIGADSLFAIETWVHPERIFPLCVILAAYRDEIDTPEEMQEQIDLLRERYHADIRLLASPLVDISSHELREAIREGRSISGLLPEKVEEYIIKEGLYGTKDK